MAVENIFATMAYVLFCSICATMHCQKLHPGGWHKTCVKLFCMEWRTESEESYPTPDEWEPWICPICLGAIEDYEACPETDKLVRSATWRYAILDHIMYRHMAVYNITAIWR
jgi:hypothetical protein